MGDSYFALHTIRPLRRKLDLTWTIKAIFRNIIHSQKNHRLGGLVGLSKGEEGDRLEAGGELVVDVDRVGCQDGGEGLVEWNGEREGVLTSREGEGFFGVC